MVVHHHLARQVLNAESEHFARIIISRLGIGEIHIGREKVEPQSARAVLEGVPDKLFHVLTAAGHRITEDARNQNIVKSFVQRLRDYIMTQKAAVRVLLAGVVDRFLNEVDSGVMQLPEYLDQE